MCVHVGVTGTEPEAPQEPRLRGHGATSPSASSTKEGMQLLQGLWQGESAEIARLAPGFLSGEET